ncbi:hypothetical protein [Brevibacterium sp. XM4083]|uniref:hypothetical protein n=1 Tax=Brevibacterium sp. XM4083 TaxID=2583238 RepID=UPI00112DE616|nr:hypothetical protein [Brevibacterium sp. XM4083]MCM1011784.1 hypothetical protein [Brevibacterium sp. XM4083]
MAVSQGPAPAVHESSCERAASPDCYCMCDGMMHQRDVLIAAFESRGTPADFDRELTRLFGSPFTTLSMDPVPPDRDRRDNWEPMASASTAKKRSQVEQRVVDVALRDLLRIVHAMPPHSKPGWSSLLNALTIQASWGSIVTQIAAIAGPHDEVSGYFWGSMLAAASGAQTLGSSVSPADIGSFPGSVSTVFDQARHPRANAGNTVKMIKEMTYPNAVSVAAKPVASAWSTTTVTAREKGTVLAIVGSAVSPDLWHHPAAVRYLLLPAVSGIRALVPSASFSLDSAIQTAEDAIRTELAEKWRDRGVW